ncbi:MAG: DUF177 domain-containing protein [Pseudomonadota bacterium]
MPKLPSDTALRVADLSSAAPTGFDLRPAPESLANLAETLGVIGLRKVRFRGDIRAEGQDDWVLRGKLGASVIQACSVTLEPVTTRIDTDVTRHYTRDFQEIETPEAEMPEDDSVEPLGQWIDPGAVLQEALSLNLPLYPRAEGAELGEAIFTEPGELPMRDEDARPFAGLAGLRDALKKGD